MSLLYSKLNSNCIWYLNQRSRSVFQPRSINKDQSIFLYYVDYFCLGVLVMSNCKSFDWLLWNKYKWLIRVWIKKSFHPLLRLVEQPCLILIFLLSELWFGFKSDTHQWINHCRLSGSSFWYQNYYLFSFDFISSINSWAN